MVDDCSCYGGACFENGDVSGRSPRGEESSEAPESPKWTAIAVLDNSTSTTGGDSAEVAEAKEPRSLIKISDQHFHSDGALFVALVSCFTLATGAIIFILLAGGLAGLSMTIWIILTSFWATFDIAVRVTDNLGEAETTLSASNLQHNINQTVKRGLAVTVTDNPEAEQTRSALALHSIVVKRGALHLAYGVLLGLSLTLWYSAYDPGRNGEWQIEAIIHTEIYHCLLVFNARMVFQIHHDKPANVWRWICVEFLASLLRDIGNASPYPLIYFVGTFMYLLNATVGLYVLVHLDGKAEPHAIRKGYIYCCVALGYKIAFYSLQIITVKSLPIVVASALLMLLQKVALQIAVPIAKRCWGDDKRRMLWTYVMPSVLLGFELPACLLFLRSRLADPNFWYLLVLQESNSVMKNAGYYDQLYSFVRQIIGRPISDSARQEMEVKRSVLAPCDNIAEIASPVIIVIVLAFSGLFDVCGLDRAPYLADSGIVDAWQMGQERVRGEVPIMLLLVLAVRVVFCCIEMKLRKLKRRKKTTTADAYVSTTAGPRQRRSSMSVLYNRIIHSRNAPVHMKYASGVWFAWIAVIIVVLAASFGRRL